MHGFLQSFWAWWLFNWLPRSKVGDGDTSTGDAAFVSGAQISTGTGYRHDSGQDFRRYIDRT